MDENGEQFPQYLERYRQAGIGLAWKILGDDAEAEDAAQDALSRAWELRDKWDPGAGSLKSWFFGLVRVCCLERRRQGHGLRPFRSEAQDRPQIVSLDDEWDEDSEPAEEVDEQRAQLRVAVEELAGRQREVIELYLQGYTQQEIGDMLGMRQRTVSEYMARAVVALRRKCKVEG